jgi:long-chain fatty acid transport protein
MPRIIAVLIAVMFSFSFVTSALATGAGGWRLEVADTEAYAKGGAFAGEADNPGAVFYNPAGITQIKKTAMTLGLAVVQPFTEGTSTAGTKAKMERDTHYIPNFYYVSNFGLAKATFGFGLTSFWGLVTEWPQDSFMRFNATKSEIQSKDWMVTGAYEVTEKLSLALGVDIDASMVDLQKKVLQTGGADGNFRLKGDHNGVALRVAGLYKLNERHQFGLMYRSTTPHKYTGSVMLDGLSDVNPATPYQSIFGGTSFQTDVISKVNLPQSVVVGYSYRPTSKWIFNIDAEWTDWSSYEEFELAYPSLNDANDPGLGLPGTRKRDVLNDGNPAPKDWTSVIATAIGAEYAVSDRLRLRGGFYYHQNPVPAATWSPMLPDSDSHAFTTGFGYDIKKDLTFDFAYGAMFYNKRNVSNSVTSGTIDGTYEQWTNLVFASVTYSF